MLTKLLLYTALTAVVPPVGLFLALTDGNFSIASRTIAFCIGLPLAVVIYALTYQFAVGLFAPAA